VKKSSSKTVQLSPIEQKEWEEREKQREEERRRYLVWIFNHSYFCESLISEMNFRKMNKD
jgi:hypothetical protein